MFCKINNNNNKYNYIIHQPFFEYRTPAVNELGISEQPQHDQYEEGYQIRTFSKTIKYIDIYICIVMIIFDIYIIINIIICVILMLEYEKIISLAEIYFHTTRYMTQYHDILL